MGSGFLVAATSSERWFVPPHRSRASRFRECEAHPNSGSRSQFGRSIVVALWRSAFSRSAWLSIRAASIAGTFDDATPPPFWLHHQERSLPLDHVRRTATQNHLSILVNFGRRFFRFRTETCCRRTRFSSSKLPRRRKRRTKTPNESRKKRNIDEVIADARVEEAV